jgi:hypothetical protein
VPDDASERQQRDPYNRIAFFNEVDDEHESMAVAGE